MCDKTNECLTAILISALLGLGIGFAFFSGVITGIIQALWIAFGIGILSLILLIILPTIAKGEQERCICKKGECLLLGALGTIVLSIISLSITLATASAGFAILIGALGAFLALTILAIANLIRCLIKATCRCRE